MKGPRFFLTVISVLAMLACFWTRAAAQINVPSSPNAPKVGDRIPEFTLPDSTGKPVSLSELLSTPLGEHKQPWVLLIFYRGYW